MARTMMGMPSPIAVGPGPTQEPQRSVGSEVPPDAPKRPQFQGTMIGMPAPNLEQVRSAFEQTKKPTPTFPEDNDTRTSSLAQTMIGTGHSTSETHPAPAGARSGGKFGSTILGVAQPGIAPLSPGGGQAPAPPRAVSSGPSPSSFPKRVPTGIESRPVAKPFPTARPSWMNAAVIGGGMVAAAAIGGAAALLAGAPVTVSVKEFSIDEEGRDHLRLACPKCPDGSTLEYSGEKVRVKSGQAELIAPVPFALGRNELAFSYADLNGKTHELKKVILPIAFRVLTNWDGRHADPPHGEIVIAAPAGSEVRINGEVTKVRGERAAKKFPLKGEATGESRTALPVEFKVPVEVTVSERKRETSAALKGVITPLTLITPGPEHHLRGGPVTFCGQTAKHATVTLADQKTEADDSGNFVLTVKAPEEGEYTLVASTDRMLSRRLTVKLTNSPALPANAKSNYDQIAVGDEVRLSGNVIESRVHDGTTRALLEVEHGCQSPPCLVRANYAEPVTLKPNRKADFSGVAVPGDPLTVRVRRFH